MADAQTELLLLIKSSFEAGGLDAANARLDELIAKSKDVDNKNIDEAAEAYHRQANVINNLSDTHGDLQRRMIATHALTGSLNTVLNNGTVSFGQMLGVVRSLSAVMGGGAMLGAVGLLAGSMYALGKAVLSAVTEHKKLIERLREAKEKAAALVSLNLAAAFDAIAEGAARSAAKIQEQGDAIRGLMSAQQELADSDAKLRDSELEREKQRQLSGTQDPMRREAIKLEFDQKQRLIEANTAVKKSETELAAAQTKSGEARQKQVDLTASEEAVRSEGQTALPGLIEKERLALEQQIPTHGAEPESLEGAMRSLEIEARSKARGTRKLEESLTPRLAAIEEDKQAAGVEAATQDAKAEAAQRELQRAHNIEATVKESVAEETRNMRAKIAEELRKRTAEKSTVEAEKLGRRIEEGEFPKLSSLQESAGRELKDVARARERVQRTSRGRGSVEARQDVAQQEGEATAAIALADRQGKAIENLINQYVKISSLNVENTEQAARAAQDYYAKLAAARIEK